MLKAAEELALRKAALQIRRNILRLIKAGKAGHVGGALSMAEVLTALYFRVMKIDPARPDWPERDRLVVSAGHKALVLYAALAARGYFPEELLDTYGSLGCRLPGHPDMHKLPGVEASTGALGHGLSIAGGMALGLRLSGLASRVFVVMGDGELAEGSNWEAAAAASHHRLENLVVIVDRNGLQISGPTVEVMTYEPLEERWRSFGWATRRVDGHDFGGHPEDARGGALRARQAQRDRGRHGQVARASASPRARWSTTTGSRRRRSCEQAERDLAAIERTLVG